MSLINKKNLDEKSLTNAEVIAMLNTLALELDECGFSRTLDVMEDLTGDRSFSHLFKDGVIKEAKNSLANKVVSANVL